MFLDYFNNICPQCKKSEILDFIFITKKQCSNCGISFMPEQGAFTGPLYLNLSITGVITMPFIFLLALELITPLGAAFGCIFFVLLISPFTLRLSKLFWINANYAKKTEQIKPR